MMRRRGFRDSETPFLFSYALAKVYSKLSSNRSNQYVDFESYFMNALNEMIRLKQLEKKEKFHSEIADAGATITAKCVSVLDDQMQKILYARVVEKLSFESIAERFQFSNAVIAQYEVNKAFNQLEGIVKLRMNISKN